VASHLKGGAGGRRGGAGGAAVGSDDQSPAGVAPPPGLFARRARAAASFPAPRRPHVAARPSPRIFHPVDGDDAHAAPAARRAPLLPGRPTRRPAPTGRPTPPSSRGRSPAGSEMRIFVVLTPADGAIAGGACEWGGKDQNAGRFARRPPLRGRAPLTLSPTSAAGLKAQAPPSSRVAFARVLSYLNKNPTAHAYKRGHPLDCKRIVPLSRAQTAPFPGPRRRREG
jgi:hypothetical protein